MGKWPKWDDQKTDFIFLLELFILSLWNLANVWTSRLRCTLRHLRRGHSDVLQKLKIFYILVFTSNKSGQGFIYTNQRWKKTIPINSRTNIKKIMKKEMSLLFVLLTLHICLWEASILFLTSTYIYWGLFKGKGSVGSRGTDRWIIISRSTVGKEEQKSLRDREGPHRSPEALLNHIRTVMHFALPHMPCLSGQSLVNTAV